MKQLIWLLLAASLVSCNKRKPTITGLEGKPLPEFNLLLTDSVTKISTSSIAAGQPLVLFYFSPRCPYCRAEMKEIVDHIRSFNHLRFALVTNYPCEEVRAFAAYYKLNNYSNVVIGVDVTQAIEQYFKITGVPYTAFYKRNKTLEKVYVGGIGITPFLESDRDNQN